MSQVAFCWRWSAKSCTVYQRTRPPLPSARWVHAFSLALGGVFLLVRAYSLLFSSRIRHTRCLSDWSSDVCSSDQIFFSSRRRHTRCLSDWSSDVCSSDLLGARGAGNGTCFPG